MTYKNFDFRVYAAKIANPAKVRPSSAAIATLADAKDANEAPSLAGLATLARDTLKPANLITPQTDVSHCFICGVRETAEALLIPVLSGFPAYPHHWLHPACWPEHVRRCQDARRAMQ